MTQGNKILKTVLVEAAWGATKMKESWYKKKYYVLAARRGKKRALIAIAHKLLIAAYHILKNGVPYKQPDLKYLITT